MLRPTLQVMQMRRFMLAPLGLIFVSALCPASFIGNDGFTTQVSTGLDWLDLNQTTAQAYEEAVQSNAGWRHATNAEVELLFEESFPGYFDTDALTTGHGSSDSLDGAYAAQNEDAAEFIPRFGITWVNGLRDYSYGLYEDEDGVLRGTGAFLDPLVPHSRVLGLEFVGDYENGRTTGVDEYGVFLVRASVPAPPGPIALVVAGALVLVLRRRRTDTEGRT